MGLTKVILTYRKKRLRVKLLFGKPVVIKEVRSVPGARDEEAYFTPQSVFAIEVWEANDYGTIRWHIYILKTVAPGKRLNRIPHVLPGAEILLVVRGEEKVRRVKEWLAELKSQGEDLISLDPDYYRSSHSKIKVKLKPRHLSRPHGKVLNYLKKRKASQG